MENSTILVFGHKNPDTDSICAAIAMAELKRREGYSAKACALGAVSRETQFVLDKFNVPAPEIIDNVRTQVKDLKLDKVSAVKPETSILDAYTIMEEKHVRTLPVCDDDKRLLGILTMKDIAMDLIRGDIYELHSTTGNIIKGLGGKPLTGIERRIKGRILVMALDLGTLEREMTIDENSIAIVGDRYETIELAINSGAQMIIVTGDKSLPETLLKKGRDKNIPIISVEHDTYTVAKILTSCNEVSSIMIRTGIVNFGLNDQLRDVQEVMRTNRHTLYPVVGEDHKYHGYISRSHILRPRRKPVIMVDHNEYIQSAKGIEEAEIIEIVDHHKIGAVRTNTPIHFMNVPVGSTCTIIYNMYLDGEYEIDKALAGIMISGIISDTLCMKSPTTTKKDIRAIKALAQIIELDVEAYAMEMFKEGSRLDGQSADEILFKDYKTFEVDGSRIGIGQVFTLDIKPVMQMQLEFLKCMAQEHEKAGNAITLFLATDIIREGSYIFFCAEDMTLLETAFGQEPEQGMFVNWIVSRKKQVVPRLMDAIEQANVMA